MNEILEKLEKRFFKSFLDITILKTLKETPNLSGNAVYKIVCVQPNELLSINTIYNTLHKLERKKLVKKIREGQTKKARSIYKLTFEGKKYLMIMSKIKPKLTSLTEELFERKNKEKEMH